MIMKIIITIMIMTIAVRIFHCRNKIKNTFNINNKINGGKNADSINNSNNSNNDSNNNDYRIIIIRTVSIYIYCTQR